MTIAVFEEEAADREQFQRAFREAVIQVVPEPLRQETAGAAANAEVLSVFVKSEVSKEVLKTFPKLRFIATRSTGYDHIDLAECAARGVVVSNVPSYGENSVAEHAFALILALSRKIFQSYERTERFRFNRDGLQGFDLLGKTLGVVGTGRIGRFAVKIGCAFGMHVLAYDAKPNAALAEEFGFSYVGTLDALLAASDVITIHAPYLPSTHHLINMDNIKKVKKGAILVNTARGALVDTAALVWALDQGILQGAGLDVLEEEGALYEEIELLSRGFPKDQDIATILRNHILIARDDVIITPHNAFNTTEALQRIVDTTIENIQAFLAGAPVNAVPTPGA